MAFNAEMLLDLRFKVVPTFTMNSYVDDSPG